VASIASGLRHQRTPGDSIASARLHMTPPLLFNRSNSQMNFERQEMFRPDIPDRVPSESRITFAIGVINHLCLAHRSDYVVGESLAKTSDEQSWALNELILGLTGAISSAKADGNSISTSEWWSWVGDRLNHACSNAGPARKRMEYDLALSLDFAARGL
jgi:hypothetical protein